MSAQNSPMLQIPRRPLQNRPIRTGRRRIHTDQSRLNTACTTIHDVYLQEVFPGQDSSGISKVVVPAPEPPSPIHGMTMQELLRYHVLEFDKG